MRARRGSATDLASNPILVGSILLLTALIGVIVSYGANRGLPFVPTYQITADVPDAAELVVGGSEVRIGGARVGIVKEMTAVPGQNGKPPFARLKLSLDKSNEGLPVDTTVQVRPRSILGAKYVDLVVGKSKQEIPPGGRIPLKNAKSVVELDEAFNVFDEETSKGIQNAVTVAGDSLAGRGSAINESVAATASLLPRAERVLRVLISPKTDLPGFIDGLAQFTSALEPVAPQLGSLFDHGATTMQALAAAGDSLGEAIHQFPATAAIGTRALNTATPVLADAAAITHDLRPAAKILGASARRLDASLVKGTPVLKATPAVAKLLETSLKALDKLARDPSASGAVRKLTTTVVTLGSTLSVLNPAQLQCNTLGLWARNVASTAGQGDAAGPWINALLVLDVSQMLQTATPAPNLHVNYYPNENGSECESGNEPYAAGQAIGNPAGNQSNKTQNTAPLGPIGGTR